MSTVNGFQGSNNGYSNGFHASDTTGKIITCKAAVVWGPGEPFVIEEVQVDPPQKMEVRIKILFTSICHTDLSAWLGHNEAQRAFPRILGHEASGIVESVGEGVEDLKTGDHVVPIFNGECGGCAYCKCEQTNLCTKFRVNPMKRVMDADGQPRFWMASKDGEERRPVYHFLNVSSFAEYTVVDSACAVRIQPAAPLHKMCLLSCCISTGVGAVWNTANVHEGSKVAIFGLGAVGLAVAEGARLRGASQIIGVDINPDKMIKGREMGVTDFINPANCKNPINEAIKEMTKGGVDFSFECAGNLDVLREAFTSTHDGWGLTVILGIHPTPRLLPLHPMELFDGRRMVGCVFGDFKGKSHLPEFVEKYMKGDATYKLNLDGFITHKLPFEKINEAFRLLQQGKSLRCLLHL
ncbi:alcohol dehydrogenase-like 4 [Dioscorea cayenensis subsp. rotundata]|uniref:Alcohol dehydrogenase-like 4 n=1 Tax=Dioscorea cayennensis subsp. rotundata TaxID=55577 RepID=A0AB40B6H2_DIOCR|nr:alcohol dehydrogenase-like 4 [Dioscorea cayenensis subsp. rotundata]